MSLSPEQIDSLSLSLMRLYQDAELELLRRMARALDQGMDAPDWVTRKLLQVQLLQAQTMRQMQGLTVDVTADLTTALVQAYNLGAAGALADSARGRSRDRAIVAAQPSGLPAVDALIRESVGRVTSTHAGILRSVGDVYRQVVARTSPQVLLGTQTRREATQSALDEFARRGITGFTDSAGRRWQMDTYAEMATRSATMNAATQGFTERMVTEGHDLVIVSDHTQECKLCRPWEGKVLSLSGRPNDVGVRVAGTLAEAKSDGLFHPGCRHSITRYIPGVTKAPRRTADPQGDADRRRLRYLERKVRESKRLEAVAMDDAAAVSARARVRVYQARIRDHVGSTSAKRQPAREQIGRTH